MAAKVRAPSRLAALVAAAGYLLLALVVALPALVGEGPSFLGHPQSDCWKHVWGHWWLGTQLGEGGGWPIHTRLQNFPWGGTLFVIDPFNALASMLLQSLVPPHVAFNTLVILQMAFGGWAAWRLASSICGDAAAAAVAGVIYGFSPWMLSYSVASGVSETLGIGWIPLAALWVLGTAASGAWEDALLAALALIMAALSSWYFLVYALVLSALLLTGAARAEEGLPRVAAGAWRPLALALVLAAVTLLPLALKFYASLADTSSLGPRDRASFTASPEYQENFFRVSDFLIPGKHRLEVSTVVDRLVKTPYLGWLALALACIAVRRDGARARIWLAGAGLFLLLSLGPLVRFSADLRSEAPVNLAYGLASPLLGFSLASAPYRIHVLTLLCLAVLAALGLARLTAGRRWVAGLAAGLAFAEICLVSPAPFPLPTSLARPLAVYQGLSLDEASGVLDLPPLRYRSQLVPGEYYYYQTAHHGGIPYLAGGVFDARLARNAFFVQMWRLAAGQWPPAGDSLAAGLGLEELAGLGYRFVVLHASDLPPPQFSYAKNVLIRWLGPPQIQADGALRFVLAPACTKRD